MGHKDENLIVVDLLLVKDMSHFISIYNQGKSLKQGLDKETRSIPQN